MALTGLTIDTDRSEYSRLETKRSTVKVRVVPTPTTGLVNESVVVSLVKKGVTIWSSPLTFNGSSPKGQVLEIDLTAIADANGDTHITRGKYTVEATQDSLAAKQQISVALITAAEMRKSYCQGLHLVSGLKLAAKRQPSVVTGVTITDVSKGHRTGVVGLAYNATDQTLTWGNGVPIEISGSENEILIDAKGNWIEVDIDQFALPAIDASEGILLAEDALDDDFISREIEKATQEIEDTLKVFLEPTRIATEPYYSNPEQGEYFDHKAMPVSYQPRDFNIRGVSWQLNLPYHQVTHVETIEGYMGNTPALGIKNGALAVNKKSGVVNVLPYNSQYTYLYTFFTLMNFWGIREFVPDFWRYKATCGITEMTPGDVLKQVGYTAACSILITAEQAYRAGVSSESISKDGVSHSKSYNAKGIYDATIQEYKAWLKDAATKHRNIYRGIPCVVM